MFLKTGLKAKNKEKVKKTVFSFQQAKNSFAGFEGLEKFKVLKF